MPGPATPAAVATVSEEIAFLERPPGALRVMSFNPYWDAIFPDEIAADSFMPRYDKAAAFRRIATATAPDILCLQEIAPARDPQQVAAILDGALPVDGEGRWHAHSAADSVIASRFDLSFRQAVAVHEGDNYALGHATALVNLPDTLPTHNAATDETYTWRDDRQQFNPGALDRILFSDSALSLVHAFVLNTATLSGEALDAAGLEAADVALDLDQGHYDHLPLVADFR